jgi:hypothetical protein
MKAGKRPRPWTPEHDRLVRELPPEEAAKATRRTLVAIYRRRKRLGLTTPRHKRDWTPAEDRAVRKLPPREAAEALGRSLPSVYFRRHLLGLGGRGPLRRWTGAEDRTVLSGRPAAAAAELPGRSLAAIRRRRRELLARAHERSPGR